MQVTTVAEVGKAGAGHQADVTRANHGNMHWSLRLRAVAASRYYGCPPMTITT